MGDMQVEVAAVIDGRPDEIYAILADYVDGHPAILPKQFFADLAVTQGGQGAGTHVTVQMDVYGTKRTYHLVVSEPEPGRTLVEEDADAGVYTTFTVEPAAAPDQSRVTIATRSRVAPGLAGLMEKLISPFVTRRIYRAELTQLAQVVQARRE